MNPWSEMIMNKERKSKSAPLSGRQIVKIILGILIFGILMGIRTEMHYAWLRIACAGCAGAALGFAIVSFRRR
ncbi:MAG: hypothetical protein FDX30_11545 [Chlorobium sp.]|nr:MAG: hypothetical protein FDX30_11545 [Chlorobium sp.]